MTCACIKKGAAERLDWVIQLTDWMATGDTIISADVPVSTGLTVDAVVEDGATVRLWLEGGEAGVSYLLRLKITTAAGRIRTECIKVRIR